MPNGVHFGIVTDYKKRKWQRPIVMTVPMCLSDQSNIIVAEDLHEFFSIGFHAGWFGLEQLVYDFNRTIEYYSSTKEDLSSQERAFLEIIREKLKLKFMPLTKRRLAELKSKYFDILDIDTSDPLPPGIF